MLDDRESPLTLYIKEHVERSPLSDDEIGILVGFKNGNLIRAFAEGEISPPLDRLDKLADVLGCDYGRILTMAIKEWFSPEVFKWLQGVNLNHMDHAETTWIRALNEIFEGKIPEMNDKLRARLELVMKRL